VSYADTQLGAVEYRCIALANVGGINPLLNVKVYLDQPLSGITWRAGIDPTPASELSTSIPQAGWIDVAKDVPPNVNFSAADSIANAVPVGNLPINNCVMLWLERSVPVGAAPGTDDAKVNVVFTSDLTTFTATREASWKVHSEADDCPSEAPALVSTVRAFKRVFADYRVPGMTQIGWEFADRFIDPGPYSFQLQFAHSGIPGADWTNVGLVAVDVAVLFDDKVQRLYGKTRDAAYRIQLTTPKAIYYSTPATTLGHLQRRDWTIVRDMVRQENLRHKKYTSVGGWLLKAKRYGEPCTACIDPLTGDITNSDCVVCRGQGILCGFYAPLPSYFVDTSQDDAREQLNNELIKGTEKIEVISGRLPGFPAVVQNDAFVNASSDERFYIHRVTEVATYRSIPVVHSVELRKAPMSDVLYTVTTP
jgi:hypothetical protein